MIINKIIITSVFILVTIAMNAQELIQASKYDDLMTAPKIAIAASASAMKASGNPFEPIIYEGAGHGFFRSGENQNATEANRLAREQGIQRLKEILKGL